MMQLGKVKLDVTNVPEVRALLAEKDAEIARLTAENRRLQRELGECEDGTL